MRLLATARPWTRSLFPLIDALHFLEFVLADPPAVPHIEAVASFELGLLLLTRATELGELSAEPDGVMTRHPLARIIRFSSSPNEVLRAILSGCRPPDQAEEAHWILLAPRLENFSRLADDTEARVFASLHSSTAAERAACEALCAAGALLPARA